VDNKESIVATEKVKFTAKDFAVKTTWKDGEHNEDELVIGGETAFYRDDELAITCTYNYEVMFKVVRKKMLQYLYATTLTSREALLDGDGSDFESYADREALIGANQNPDEVAKFERCLESPQWCAWFEEKVGEATRSLLAQLPTRLFVFGYLKLEAEVVHHAVNHAFFPPDVAAELDKEGAKVTQKVGRNQTKQIFHLPGPGAPKGSKKKEVKYNRTELCEKLRKVVRSSGGDIVMKNAAKALGFSSGHALQRALRAVGEKRDFRRLKVDLLGEEN
jgi:hypothetical protein